MKINFVLPFKPRRPAGGFKVMYEYANRLSKLGYSVHLLYPLHTRYMKYRLPYLVRLLLSYMEGFRRDKWFDFDPNITMEYIPKVSDKYIPDADVIIATWWATALDMGKLNVSKGRKINLIQGFENWTGHEDLLYKSYNMKETTNIVVASYLKNIVQEHSTNETILITNAIDKKQYFISSFINKRKKDSACMMYSVQEIKGSHYGLEALIKVKEKYPDLTVDLFGVCPKPESLPDWMNYYRDPDNLCEIYNQNAIFVTNSFTEGMALTPLEAMFCGCALICTDIQGHYEYAKNEETALLVEVKNVDQLANSIIRLIEDNDYRIQLAHKGNEYVQRFSWDLAVDKMQNVIQNKISNL